MTAEQWRPIPGHDGYEVSDLGRVMSYKGKQPRELRQSVGKRGYPVVSLSNGAPNSTPVYRLVALAFIGPLPAGLETLHRDGNKLNSRLDNLHYSDRFENAQDTVRHGQHVNASRTECRDGHEFTELNTYYKAGRRHCRQCNAARTRAYRIRKALRAANVPDLAA